MFILDFITKLFGKTVPESAWPQSYGTFHIIFILLVVVATTLLCIFFKNSTDKVMRRIALIFWILITVLEIIKQVLFAYRGDGNYSYAWGSLPFQLCSSPLYALPFVAFMKDCKFRDTMMAFISTFAFFGGLVVFVYPNDVFYSEFVFIHYQTMIHHGTQLIIGIYLFVYNRKKANLMYFVRSILVFVAFCAVAFVLNEIMHVAKPDLNFNMFYFSPYIPNHLPILSAVWAWADSVGAPIIFMFVYILGFTGISLGIQYAMVGINKLVQKLSKKNA